MTQKTKDNAVAATSHSQLTRNRKSENEEIQISQTYTGPLPPPTYFAQYEQIYPGAANRILKMAEREQAMAESSQQHNLRMEEIAIQAKIKEIHLGQVLGFLIALVALIGSFLLIAFGKDIIGIATLLGSIATFGTAFLYDLHASKNKE